MFKLAFVSCLRERTRQKILWRHNPSHTHVVWGCNEFVDQEGVDASSLHAHTVATQRLALRSSREQPSAASLHTARSARAVYTGFTGLWIVCQKLARLRMLALGK